jgi:hypothetical protein
VTTSGENVVVTCGSIRNLLRATLYPQSIKNSSQAYARNECSLAAGKEKKMPGYPQKQAALSSLSGRYNEYN